jgi:hypothetical protein
MHALQICVNFYMHEWKDEDNKEGTQIYHAEVGAGV